jgi:hypothetical protein
MLDVSTEDRNTYLTETVPEDCGRCKSPHAEKHPESSCATPSPTLDTVHVCNFKPTLPINVPPSSEDIDISDSRSLIPRKIVIQGLTCRRLTAQTTQRESSMHLVCQISIVGEVLPGIVVTCRLSRYESRCKCKSPRRPSASPRREAMCEFLLPWSVFPLVAFVGLLVVYPHRDGPNVSSLSYCKFCTSPPAEPFPQSLHLRPQPVKQSHPRCPRCLLREK